jgi:hypothetical protein
VWYIIISSDSSAPILLEKGEKSEKKGLTTDVSHDILTPVAARKADGAILENDTENKGNRKEQSDF